MCSVKLLYWDIGVLNNYDLFNNMLLYLCICLNCYLLNFRLQFILL